MRRLVFAGCALALLAATPLVWAQAPAAGGAGAAAGAINVNLTPAQQASLREALMANFPQPVREQVNVAVGTVVPATFPWRACPDSATNIIQALRGPGCRFFLLPDGRLAVVRFDTRAIVYVVPAA
jgi:hypothetical protein